MTRSVAQELIQGCLYAALYNCNNTICYCNITRGVMLCTEYCVLSQATRYAEHHCTDYNCSLLHCFICYLFLLTAFLSEEDILREFVEFAKAHCHIFEDSEENKLSYMPIYEQFTSLFEKRIESLLTRSGYSPEEFIEAVESELERQERKDRKRGVVRENALLSIIFAMTSFEAFKEIMLQEKTKLSEAADGLLDLVFGGANNSNDHEEHDAHDREHHPHSDDEHTHTHQRNRRQHHRNYSRSHSHSRSPSRSHSRHSRSHSRSPSPQQQRYGGRHHSRSQSRSPQREEQFEL